LDDERKNGLHSRGLVAITPHRSAIGLKGHARPDK
jgi:hypothetical protein